MAGYVTETHRSRNVSRFSKGGGSWKREWEGRPRYQVHIWITQFLLSKQFYQLLPWITPLHALFIHTHASTVAHIQKTAAAFTLPSSLAFRTSAKVWRFAPREPGSGNCNPGPGNYLISIATAIAGTNIHKNWFVNSLASLRFFAFAFVLALLHLPYRRLPRTRTSAGDQCCQVRV